jgi:superfamily II DNA/RNA helicase
MKSYRLAFVFFTRKIKNMPITTVTPITSFSSFNLHDNINKGLISCGYILPTPVQAGSIPAILAGKDVVACAQTGTGKTAAFVLPALHCVSERRAMVKPRVLILTPTRELATQISAAITKYSKFMRVHLASLVGGMPYRQQLRELSRPVDIIIATPGRLMDHMANGRLDLSGIEMLVLDEADRMLDMGFVDDVKDIAKATPATRQTLLFSATVDPRLGTIIKQLLKEPVRIDLSSDIIASPLIEQKMYLADNMQHKNRLLNHFLANENVFKAIIFSATKIHADQLAKQLRDDGFAAGALHGDLKQAVRNRTIESFRRNKIQFLVATDVAARGLDINDVTHVINYDLPKFSEDYVHRIGRTGRAGKTGIAISFAVALDARHLQKIERYIGEKIQMHIVEGLEPTKRMSKAPAAPERGGKKRFGKSDAKSGYANRKEGKSFGYKKSGSQDEPRNHFSRDDRPAKKSYSRDERPAAKSFSRPERPTYARDDSRPAKSYARDDRSAPRSFSRDDKPAGKSFNRDDRSAGRSFNRDDRSAGRSFSRDDKPAGRSFSRDDKPAGRSFSRDDKPAGRSFSRDDKPAGRSFSRDDKPAGRSFSRDGKPAGRTFNRDDKPAGRTFNRDNKPAGRSFSRDDKPADRSFSRDAKPERANTRFAKKPAQQDSKFAEGRGKPFAKNKERKNRAIT